MNFNKVEFTSSYGTKEQLPPSDLPEIVFSGRSNVGKSSLINKIFNRKNLARVSSVPGKTVTINFFRCEDVNFVDLPGYGYARASASEIKRWGSTIEAYFNSGRNISLVIQLLDFRHKPSDDDFKMLDFLSTNSLPFIIVFTKADKLNKTHRAARIEEVARELADYDAEAFLFSALSGEGVEELKEKIVSVAEGK